jgi:hypothetical protein
MKRLSLGRTEARALLALIDGGYLPEPPRPWR